MFTKRAVTSYTSTNKVRKSFFETNTTQIDKDQAISKLQIIWGCMTRIVNRLMILPPSIVDSNGRRVDSLPLWIREPISGLPFPQLISQMTISLVHYGNAYLVPLLDERGAVRAVYCLDSLKMEVIPDRDMPNGIRYVYDGQEFNNNLVHQRYITQPGKLVGLGALEAALQGINIGDLSQSSLEQFYKNGASVRYVVNAKGGASQEELESLRTHIDEYISGPHNAGKTGVFAGDIEISPISSTVQESQLIELSKWSDAKMTAQIYHLPVSLMGVNLPGNQLTYNNEQARENKIWRDALRPIALCIELALSHFLSDSNKLVLDPRNTLLGNAKDRADITLIYAKTNQALGKWVFTGNEIRDINGFLPLDGPLEDLNAPNEIIEVENDVQD